MNREKYTLSVEDNKRIFDEAIIPSLYDSTVPSLDPSALFFRGQPGSGKSVARSRVLDTLRERDGGNSVMVIDIDAFRRFHPMHSSLQETDEANAAFYTDLDSGAWTEHAIDHSMQLGSHVTLEGTLRNEAPTLKTAREFQEYGVRSELYLLAVHELTSRHRIFQRYIEQLHDYGKGRYTLPNAHDVAYNALPATAQRTVRSGLFERVHIIDQRGDIAQTVNGRDSEVSEKVSLALDRVRQLSSVETSEVGDMIANLRPDINEQDNQEISRDFETLVADVRQLSVRALGGFSLVAESDAGKV